MKTIKEYIEYYGQKKTCDIHWNIMDSLICSILVYLPLDPFRGEMNLAQLTEYSRKFEDRKKDYGMAPVSYEILAQISEVPRYKHMKISDFENRIDENTQFGAATFRLDKNTNISYKGTDSSLIGWVENFRLSYDYPTYTHKLALNYLKKNVRLLSNGNLYVSGHSKGGNLAMVAAMEAPSPVFNKINKVYNFDGPGLRKKEFKSGKFLKLMPQLVNIIPSGSIVGVLMFNTNYIVVKSNSLAANAHYPDSWGVFGEFFQTDQLSDISTRIHHSTTKGLEKLDYEQIKTTIETIYESIDQDYSTGLDMSFENIITFLKNMKNSDQSVTENLSIIFDSLFDPEIDIKKLVQ